MNDTKLSEDDLRFLIELDQIVAQRKIEADSHQDSKSYTVSLFRKGINKVAQKVGEEAVELVIESKDDDEKLFLDEGADLLFHYLVLLRAKGYDLADIVRILKSRHQ